MTATVFVDSNVFIYAFDDADQTKQARRPGLGERNCGSDAPAESAFKCSKSFVCKGVPKVAGGAAQCTSGGSGDLLTWHPVDVNAGLFEQAWRIQDRYRLSFWDAQIVAAAQMASCHYLLTEDLQAGQNLDGVIVTNPFRDSPQSLLGQS